MANRVISALPYFQAEEFAVGANHPDGLADTINRGLVEAWGVLNPQIEDTIQLRYVNRFTIYVKIGGQCRLTSGGIVIIDTEVQMSAPAGTGINYLWIGLLDGVVSFDWSTSSTVAPAMLSDATLTRMALCSNADGLGFNFFEIASGWIYTKGLMPTLTGSFAGGAVSSVAFSPTHAPAGERNVNFAYSVLSSGSTSYILSAYTYDPISTPILWGEIDHAQGVTSMRGRCVLPTNGAGEVRLSSSTNATYALTPIGWQY